MNFMFKNKVEAFLFSTNKYKFSSKKNWVKESVGFFPILKSPCALKMY